MCKCLYTICGLSGHQGAWQDRACTATAVLRRDTAMLPVAAENDLAHLRLLREVRRRTHNVDDALLHDPLVAAVHSSCHERRPSPWITQCPSARNSFENVPAQPSNSALRSRKRAPVGQQAADLSGSIIAPAVTTRYGRASRARLVGQHHNPLDALLRASIAKPMAFVLPPAKPPLYSCSVRCTFPGSSPMQPLV
jgi:hypothetical protein